MATTKPLFIIVAAISLIVTSCNAPSSSVQQKAIDTTSTNATNMTPVRDAVLTAEEQKALTPDTVIESLRAGNLRFRGNDLTVRDHSAMVRKAAAGQYPKAVIVSCLDSRVPVEDIFNEGIGDLFVARLAGNFINEDILGSLEYACKVSGAKLIVVLGHGSCGAIKSSIDNVKLGNITGMLAKIKPAVASSKDFAGDKTSKNDDYVDYVSKKNVALAVSNITARSPILAEMARKGEIKIVGAYYSVKTGEVLFL